VTVSPQVASTQPDPTLQQMLEWPPSLPIIIVTSGRGSGVQLAQAWVQRGLRAKQSEQVGRAGVESRVGAADWFSETVQVKWQRGIYIQYEADEWEGDHHQDKNKALPSPPLPPTLPYPKPYPKPYFFCRLQGSRKWGPEEEEADLEGETQNTTAYTAS
jgi:hypothetical protein